MVDSVRLNIPWFEDLSVVERLRSPRHQIDSMTGEVVKSTGGLKNFYVELNPKGLSLYGSLPRYFLGSNLRTLTPTETGEAIAQLGMDLGVPLEDARVFSLHFGFNLPVRTHPKTITSALGPLTRFTKRVDASTVSYTHQSRAIVLYDKLSEAEERAIWEVASGKPHVLRAEVQLKRLVKAQMGEKVFGRSLAAPDFQQRMLDYWTKQMEALRFVRRVEGLTATTRGDIRQNLAQLGIERAGGVEVVLDYMKRQLDAGMWGEDRKGYTRAVADVKAWGISEPNVLCTDAEAEFREVTQEAVETWMRVISN